MTAERDAIIEVPRWTFIKWRSDGSFDYVSPLPSPFNYGCVPGTTSGDGEPIDVIVLGPRLGRGCRVRLPERGCVEFVDAGEEDPKLVLSAVPVTPRQRRQLEAFFWLYARAKRLLNRLRRRGGDTAFLGVHIDTSADARLGRG